MDYIFQQAWQFLADKLHAFVQPILDWLYLLQWYWWGGIVLFLCVFLSMMSPWQWPKYLFGWIFTIDIAALVAATLVFLHFKEKDRE